MKVQGEKRCAYLSLEFIRQEGLLNQFFQRLVPVHNLSVLIFADDSN